MSDFSAHRVEINSGEKFVIVNDINLYVSVYGDDELNVGTNEFSPFQTPQRAINWLSDKIISESGFVTINFAPGIYEILEPIVLDHPQGERIAFVGANPEVLLLQYVQWYQSYGFTASGVSGFYSGYNHGITMNCVRPLGNGTYEAIVDTDPETRIDHRTPGYGVIIEDYNLVREQNYNPIYFYAAYPSEHRNNLARQSSILGAHKLLGCTNGNVHIHSTIRDEWFLAPFANANNVAGEFFGNNVKSNIGYQITLGEVVQNAFSTVSDQSETHSLSDIQLLAAKKRQFALSTVPVGYYGSSTTTGVPIGATANFVGATFPTLAAGVTRSKYVKYNINSAGSLVQGGTFTGTGNAGSQLNDSIRFGNNFHHYIGSISGTAGIGSSANWKSINTNQVSVRIIPTVFKRNGNILSIKSGGLRKLKNIFFDGVSQPYHYSLIGSGRQNDIGYSNKFAIYASSSKLGEQVSNEPSTLGIGLFSDVGIQNFHTGVYCDRNTNGNLGRVVLSNCSYGVLSNKGSAIRLFGSVCTGSIYGFAAMNASSMIAERCFSSFSGQSLVELKLKAGSTMSFNDGSFIHGQTYSTPDGKIRGTVYDWDSSQKTLTIAVRHGKLEGIRLTQSD